MSTEQSKCFVCNEPGHQQQSSLLNLGCCDKWFHRACIDKSMILEDKNCPSCSEPIDELKKPFIVHPNSEHFEEQLAEDNLTRNDQKESVPTKGDEQPRAHPFTLRSKEQFAKNVDMIASRHREEAEKQNDWYN